MKEKENQLKTIGLAISGIILIGLILFSYVQFTTNQELVKTINEKENTITTMNEELLVTKDGLVASKEQETYLLQQLNNSKKSKEELQLLFNQLDTDFYNCFMAHYCFEYTQDCVERFENKYSQSYLFDYYSRECDNGFDMIETYFANDTDIK